MRRISALLALLAFLLALVPATVLAVDVGYDILFADAIARGTAGGMPTILYTGRANIAMRMRSQPDTESPALGTLKERAPVYIFGFDQYWLYCWDESVGVYYVGRHNVVEITPVNSSIPSYGVVPNAFVAVTGKDATLRESPSETGMPISIYPTGTRLSFWLIKDGWAVVPYKRQVGYMYMGDLLELTPVSPAVDYAQEGDIIAAFTSFYDVKNTELNVGRMENIRVGCNYIGHTYMPGETFDFNAIAGPYRQARGYMPSPVLVDGGTVAGYGGGTCQVSTTLYNAILQLPDGLTVLHRRPHGPGGASYAPHGVDAAVGRGELNLIFRNDYEFPITLDCTARNGSLCICIRKGTYDTQEDSGAQATTVASAVPAA